MSATGPRDAPSLRRRWQRCPKASRPGDATAQGAPSAAPASTLPVLARPSAERCLGFIGPSPRFAWDVSGIRRVPCRRPDGQGFRPVQGGCHGIARRGLARIVGLLALLALAVPAFAGTVSLAWDAVISPALSGYMVYYGHVRHQPDQQDRRRQRDQLHGARPGRRRELLLRRDRLRRPGRRKRQVEHGHQGSHLDAADAGRGFLRELHLRRRAPARRIHAASTPGRSPPTHGRSATERRAPSPSRPRPTRRPGTYTVGLTVTGPGGSDAQTRTGLVTVVAAPPSTMTRIGMAVDVRSATEHGVQPERHIWNRANPCASNRRGGTTRPAPSR